MRHEETADSLSAVSRASAPGWRPASGLIDRDRFTDLCRRPRGALIAPPRVDDLEDERAQVDQGRQRQPDRRIGGDLPKDQKA
jgi:hypothetical protein